MISRILRGLIVLGGLLAAYQAYVLLAVPLLEPPLAVRESQPTTDESRQHAAQSGTRYQLLLANYFPRNHWTQTQPPKVIASPDEKAMLVVDDWHRRPAEVDGKNVIAVTIERFALLVFPTPPRDGAAPRDAVILEAARGAELQFDDFRPEIGRIGQITRGVFPGVITIRSDMREPGPEDDLLIETSDLEMNSKLLYTSVPGTPVRFRMGPNIGGGRELEIRFLHDEYARKRDAGLKITGLDSLEIRQEVRMQFQLDAESLLPGPPAGSHNSQRAGASPPPADIGSRASSSPPNAGAEDGPARSNPQSAIRNPQSEKPRPPVEVTCSGPFTFDFVRYVASVDRDVELRQMHPNGPSDQVSCTQLDIHFAPKPQPGGAQPVVVDPAKRQQRELGRLQPVMIVAQGHPVVVTSPSKSAEARGDRIEIGLIERRLRLSGTPSATFVNGPNVLRGASIDYQQPARDAGTPIGQFHATGPGTLQYVPNPKKPQEVFQAAWQTGVELTRENGQPLLTLTGRPQLAFAATGTLTADQIKLYLRELEGASAGAGLPFKGGAGGNLHVTPDRLAATGHVEIHSPQLTARTDELLASFRLQSATETGAAIHDADAGSAPRTFAPGSPPPGAHPTSYHIASDKMRLAVNMHGQSAVPASVACEGNVVLREVPLVATPQQPFEVRGGQLTLDGLDNQSAHIILRGTPPGAAPGSKLARLVGRGISVETQAVELDQRENRLWSDCPGKATMLMTRDLAGRASATPVAVDLQWQGRLDFDGRTIAVDRNVIASTPDDTLRCNRLAARLTAPVQFTGRVQERSIDAAEVECQGPVTLDHLTRDATSVTSHERTQLASLTVNQQTGAIRGEGPGVLLSTRFGSSMAGFAGRNPVNPIPNIQRPKAGASKLQFLRVDFQSGLAGNFITRELEFLDGVRTVYGPVDSWEQELDASRPETLPAEAMTLTCDKLRINEDPVAARAVTKKKPPGGDGRPFGPVELQAKGNVKIDGQVPGQGPFTAQADSATYAQTNDTFRLEGDGRTPATLWRPGKSGPPYQARKIRYVRSTGDFSGQLEYLEFTPEDLEKARRTAPAR